MGRLEKALGRTDAQTKPFQRPRYHVFGGFGPFCPWLRQKVWKYYHIPAPFFLATNKIASNLGCAISES